MSLELKKAREEAGLSIEDVSKALNIRKQYIKELEKGNLDSLPGKVYIKGYTKMYCEFLGIEAPSKKIISKKNKKKSKTKKIAKTTKNKYFITFFSAILLIIVVITYINIQEL